MPEEQRVRRIVQVIEEVPSREVVDGKPVIVNRPVVVYSQMTPLPVRAIMLLLNGFKLQQTEDRAPSSPRRKRG